MLKFVKHTMDSISGIEIFPIISLIIFFSFFMGLLLWVNKSSKTYINHVENLPFEDEK
ncbi:MAG: CcoQ/FixQ family Cbb3-type cytochrome c oxidase assembly chaperone [Flavobacteriales bacterium]